MDSPRRIGLSTTRNGVLIVVYSQSALGKENAEIRGDFDDSGRTSEDAANRRLRADSARRIGLSTSWNGIRTAVWGYSALG